MTMKNIFLFGSLFYSVLMTAQSVEFSAKVNEINQKLMQKNIQVFAEINHSNEAEKVGLSLPKTIVLIVGNPKVGTMLMQENQQIALHLPLKILITEKEGKILVDYQEITPLAKKYKLKKSLPIAKKIDETMKSILNDESSF